MATKTPGFVAKLFLAATLLMLAFVLPQGRIQADDLCEGTSAETCTDHTKCQEEHGERAKCQWSEAIDKCNCGRPDIEG